MAYLGNKPATSFTKATKDTFSGDGTTTAFTLSKIATTNDVEVFVENVQQEPTSAYGISGTTLTFTGAPPSGTNNIYVIHRSPAIQTVTHPSNQNLQAVDGSFTGVLKTDTIKKADGTGGLTVPTGTGTVATTNGITMADQFRLTTDKGNGVDLGSSGEVEQTDETTSGTIGTGMTHSSGIFSFPSTGIYLVLVEANFLAQASDGTVQISIQVTTNNSSFTEYALAEAGNGTTDDNASQSGSAQLVLDITDTTNQKIKFRTSSLTGSSVVRGDTDRNETTFTFIRLGDT
jgi:hypothetical protein